MDWVWYSLLGTRNRIPFPFFRSLRDTPTAAISAAAQKGNLKRVTLEWLPERDDPDWDGENNASVKLTGTFWDWGEPKPMTPAMEETKVVLNGGTHHAKNGRFIATLDLPPGRHEFKFVVDGGHGDFRWLCSRRYGICGDFSGVENNFVDIV